MPTEPADLEFRRLVVDEERRRNAELPIDSLIALGALRQLKRLSAEELAERIQRDLASAKRTLEALTEAGFVEAHGATRGRTYMLSAAVYGAVADKAAYTRQAGFAPPSSTTRTSPSLSNTFPPWVNHPSDLPTEFFV